MTGYGNDDIVRLLLGLSPFVAAFVIILMILWFLLPFAVFGIKGKLDRIIELQEEALLRQGGGPPPPSIETQREDRLREVRDRALGGARRDM